MPGVLLVGVLIDTSKKAGQLLLSMEKSVARKDKEMYCFQLREQSNDPLTSIPESRQSFSDCRVPVLQTHSRDNERREH
jgi:hypothetical protein